MATNTTTQDVAASSTLDELSCPLCYGLLEDPVRCPCPCRRTACRDCFMHAISVTINRCAFTRLEIDVADLAVDDVIAERVNDAPSTCAYDGCAFEGTAKECEAHERTCTKRAVVLPGYYLLHHCDDYNVDRYDTGFVANDMFFHYPDTTQNTDRRSFEVGNVLGLPWQGAGRLRRNGNSGFYLWTGKGATEGEVSYTTIQVLPNGDIVGRVRGDASLGAQWTYRAVRHGPNPPPIPADDEGEAIDDTPQQEQMTADEPREPR